MLPSSSFTPTSTESRVLTKTLLDTLFNLYQTPTDHKHQPHSNLHQKSTTSSHFIHDILQALLSRNHSGTPKAITTPTMDVVEPSLPNDMKPDHEKTLAQEPRQLRDFSGETLSESPEVSSSSELLPCPSEANDHQLHQHPTSNGPHGPSEPRSKKEGQIANTPNLNSCEPHRSYQYIRSIKPKRVGNVKSRFGHRDGCLLCLFRIDHNGTSKSTHQRHAHDVALTGAQPQKLEEEPLEPQHTLQDSQVEMPIKDQVNTEPSQEIESPNIQDLNKKDTPSVEKPAGDESSEDPEVELSIEDEHHNEPSQEVKSPDIEDLNKKETPSVEDPAGDESTEVPEVEMSAKDQHNNEPPQEVKLSDIEDSNKEETPSVEKRAGDESPENPPVLESQSSVQSPQPENSAKVDATKAQGEDEAYEDGKAIDDEAEQIDDTPATESQLHTVSAPSLHPAKDDANPDPVDQATSNEGKVTDEESPIDQGVSSTKIEKKALGPSEQNDAVMPEPPTDASVKTEERENENPTDAAVRTEEQDNENNISGRNMDILARVNKKNADDAKAVALESFIPEEEGTGLGHVFPFANPDYHSQPLKKDHDAETYAMDQKDVVTTEVPANAALVKTEKRDHVISPLWRNLCILAKIDKMKADKADKMKADKAKAAAVQSSVPEGEGTSLGHIFPFANPSYDPETLENPHDAESAAKEQKATEIVGGIPKPNSATDSEYNIQKSTKDVPDKGNNEENSKDVSDNETSTVDPAQENDHSHQNAPMDGEKNGNIEEAIPSHHESEQTPVEALPATKQEANDNNGASEEQAPAETQDFKDAPNEPTSMPDTDTAPAETQDVKEAPNEPTSMPDTDTAPGQGKLEAEEEIDSKSNVTNEEIDAPTTNAVSGGPVLHRVLPFRTKSEMEVTTAAASEDQVHPEEENPQHHEDDSKNEEDIKDTDSQPTSENVLAPIDQDTELEHKCSDSSEDKQDQQCSPRMKPEETQGPTEELQEPSAIQPSETTKEVSLGEPHEPNLVEEDPAPESSSGDSEYESLSGDDDTHGEDNLISQAVSNLRHETLNDKLIDRLVEDPVRVGEIVAASAQTEEEEEPRWNENSSSVPEDLALSDEDSIPELKLSEPTTSIDKDETLDKPPPANEGDNQKSTANHHSQHDMLHDRLAGSLAENPIGVSALMSSTSGEVGGLAVDLPAPSVQAVTNDTVLPTLKENIETAETQTSQITSSTLVETKEATKTQSSQITSSTLVETKEPPNPKTDVQNHQHPVDAVVPETEGDSNGKMTGITSPLPDTQASTEIAVTTPTVSTPTKSQLRRAQAKRSKQRKVAERAAAASKEKEGPTATSTAPGSSEKDESGKKTMTKSQAKRAKKLRAKQRKLEAGKKI